MGWDVTGHQKFADSKDGIIFWMAYDDIYILIFRWEKRFRTAPIERLCAMPMCHWREALKKKMGKKELLIQGVTLGGLLFNFKIPPVGWSFSWAWGCVRHWLQNRPPQSILGMCLRWLCFFCRMNTYKESGVWEGSKTKNYNIRIHYVYIHISHICVYISITYIYIYVLYM